jgi:hypothetical protein
LLTHSQKKPKGTCLLIQKGKSPDNSPKKRSPEKSERGDMAMKKILVENKQRKFMERKK